MAKSKADKKKQDDWNLDEFEVSSLVCRFLCDGSTPAEIADKINDLELPGVYLSREDPYRIIKQAVSEGRKWLQYRPPLHEQFRERIQEEFIDLEDVAVLRTTTVADVAEHTARKLWRLIRACPRKEVHVGFAGGHSTREVARELAWLLYEPTEKRPHRIWFHALASGFDPAHPTTDPTAFFTYFRPEGVVEIERRFRGLAAPSMVRPHQMEELYELKDLAEARTDVEKLDIIVTSGTQWLDEDSALRRRMQESDASMAVLEREGCKGDILWRPLNEDGPIEVETDLRAFTLLDLSKLPELIRSKRKTRVLLMLAPCGMCYQSKEVLLRCLLRHEEMLITDLVVDSLTVRRMYAAS